MSWRIRLLALVAALAVLGVGLAGVQRIEPEYTSSATLVVTPATENTSLWGIRLERAASVGTYMTLLLDPATHRMAGSPPVKIEAITTPERPSVITASATGPEEAVRPGLRAVIDTARERQPTVRDAYRLDVFGAPSAPGISSLPTGVLTGVVVFLALLAGITVLVLPGRVGLGGDRWDLTAAETPLSFEATLIRVGPLTDSTSLLRVAGRWHHGSAGTLSVPDLVVDDGTRQVVIPAARHAGATAPAVGPDGPEWEGAYGIPAALFTRVGPPELALRADGHTFPLEVASGIWEQASPEAYEPPLASTSS